MAFVLFLVTLNCVIVACGRYFVLKGQSPVTEIKSIMNEMSELNYRELNLSDKPQMQALCLECFPIDYPDYWYYNLLEEPDEWTFTQGAFELTTGRMVGMIVGQIQSLDQLEDEYGYALEEGSSSDLVMYITIFGVSGDYRRQGIGSNLMHSLIHYTKNHTTCKVIYLHVEATNELAIPFYEKKGFIYFYTHKDYYSIEQELNDGLVYIQYINESKPYKPSLENWYRRHGLLGNNPVGQCFRKPFNSLRNFLQRSFSQP